MAGIFDTLITQTDTIVQNFCVTGYQALSTQIVAPTLQAVLVLYWVLYGWKMATFTDEPSPKGFIVRILTSSLVYAFATNWGTLAFYIYYPLSKTPAEVANVLLQAVSHNDANSVNTILQSVYDQGMAITGMIYEKGNMMSLTLAPYIGALIFSLALILSVGLALILIIFSKFMFAILIVLAPIIIPTYLFKPTHGIFNGWLKGMVTFSLMPLIIYVLAALMISLLHSSYNEIQLALMHGQWSMSSIWSSVLCSAVLLGGFTSGTMVAAQLGGGCHIDAIHSVKNALSQGASGLRAAKSAHGAVSKTKPYKFAKGKLGGLAKSAGQNLYNRMRSNP